MPSGKVHDKIAVASIVPVLLAGLFMFSFNPLKACIFTISSLFCQIMFGPDLDARSTQYKRWGIFRWLWFPYRKIFKHRSRFSHGLFFGPIIRCIYITLIAILILILVNLGIYKYTGFNTAICLYPVAAHITSHLNLHYINLIAIPILAGFFTGTAVHTITDKIVSFFKNLI